MSPVVSRSTDEADFVVVERLETLCSNQEALGSELRTLTSRLRCIEIRMTAVERTAHLNMHLRRVMTAFAAAATPIVLSVMIDQNLPSHASPLADLVRIVSKFLLAFAACVGVPLLIQAVADLGEANSSAGLLTLAGPPGKAAGDGGLPAAGQEDSGTGQEEEGEEGEVEEEEGEEEENNELNETGDSLTADE